MAKSFDISIATPTKVLYEGSIESLVAPSAFGYLGVLADHAPLASKLTSGRIIMRERSGKTLILDCEGKGFLEVLKNTVTILLNQ